MGLTIEKAAAGTPFELQDTSLGRWFEVVGGDLHGIPTARGENTTIPGAVGLSPVTHVDESMVIRVHGYIAGIGSTQTARQASFRQQMSALRAQTGSAGTLVILTATAPTLGLASGESATITAQVQTIKPSAAHGLGVQELRLGLLAFGGWASSSGGASYLVTTAGDPLVTPAGDRLYVEV